MEDNLERDHDQRSTRGQEKVTTPKRLVYEQRHGSTARDRGKHGLLLPTCQGASRLAQAAPDLPPRTTFYRPSRTSSCFVSQSARVPVRRRPTSMLAQLLRDRGNGFGCWNTIPIARRAVHSLSLRVQSETGAAVG